MSKPDQKLKDKWNKILAEEGLDDIERPDGKLKTYEANYFTQRNWHSAVERLEFFLGVTDYVRTMDKDRPREIKIMELYGDGWKQKDIAKQVGLHRWTICQIIKKHKKELKKRWKKRQDSKS